jgi:hypothetical protein
MNLSLQPVTITSKLKLPKSPAVPKIHTVQISRAANGLSVTHHLTTGPAKHFVFHDPKKMVRHIRHIQKSDWMHPNMDQDATRIDNTLNL